MNIEKGKKKKEGFILRIFIWKQNLSDSVNHVLEIMKLIHIDALFPVVIFLDTLTDILSNKLVPEI